MIHITLGTIPARGTSDPWHTATATVDGTAYVAQSRSSAVCKLCRVLRDAGVPDRPWMAVTDTGTAIMRGRSIYGMAERSISEGDRAGLQWSRHRADWSTYGITPTGEPA
jgi:hypothetical protein